MKNIEFIIVAGPKGAGKTTFATEYCAQHNIDYRGADALAAELSPNDPTSVRVAAGKMFIRKVNETLESKRYVVVESTLSGRTCMRTIQKAKSTGFEVTIIYLFLDTEETCLTRVAQRVRKGGHDVPESDVRRRFHRSAINFWNDDKTIADFWFLLNNEAPRPIEAASEYLETTTIANQQLFDRFLQFPGIGQQ